MTAPAPILDSVHAVETPLLQRCENPLCSVEFPQAGLKIEPKRYCSPQCRQETSILRRAAILLADATDKRVLEILRSP
jgi:hypothetical protein